MADAIFISYRRDDSEGEAGRLFDDLTRVFGNEAVFMDVAGIKPGVDFRKAIDDNVATCGVFLAVVGPTWATITNSAGARRLDDPNDFVALELSSALKREVPVIPVLVHDAKMPAVSLLPENLQAFAYRNSVELSHARWNSDVALLIEALKSYVTPRTAAESPVHATLPVQLPAPHPTKGNIAPVVTKNWKPLLAGVGGGVVLILAVLIYFLSGPDADKVAPAAPSTAHSAPASSAPADTKAANPESANASRSGSAAPDATPATAALGSEFAGTWKRAGNRGDSDALGLLTISGTGSKLMIHAYGRCQTPDCDWGEVQGAMNGSGLIALFAPQPNGTDTSRTAKVTCHVVPEGLDVLIENRFETPTGGRGNTSHQTFVPATAPTQ